MTNDRRNFLADSKSLALRVLAETSSNKQPLVIAYGLGVDSTAMLVGMVNRGIRPDLILFADTGAEKPETYAYLPVMNEYLRRHGYPEVIVVKYTPVRATYDNLEDNCLQNRTLPSLAFGYKKCSLKMKVAPQDKYCDSWQPAIDCWARGEKVIKAIGYDNGPKDSRRAIDKAEDEEYSYWYPLRDWGWDREECRRQILAAGLPLPLKSACFFCPASQPIEVIWMAYKHPELFRRAIELEDNARPNFTTIEGLWRTSTRTRPGSWRKFAEQKGLITTRPDGGFDLVSLDPADCPIHPDELAAAETNLPCMLAA